MTRISVERNWSSQSWQAPPSSLADVQIPTAGDFSLDQTVLTPGADWDERFPHGTPGPVMNVDGTWHLYYIGADVTDRGGDGGPAERTVGLATAPSLGGTWTKHPDNPLFDWANIVENSGNREQGVWRLAGFVDDDGTVLLYPTILHAGVSGSIHLWTSSDGVSFTRQGMVIDHADGTFPGNDEDGTLGAWREGDTYYIIYAAKGTDVGNWTWAMATGDARDNFVSGEEILSTRAFGHGTEPTLKSETELLYFMGDNNNGEFYAYTAPRSDPASVSGELETYAGLSSDQFAMVLDRANSQWVGFFTTGPQGDSTGIDRYTAPVVEV